MVPVPTLTTPRLLLRPWTPADLDALAAIEADPEVQRFFDPGLPLTHDQAAESMAGFVAEWDRLGHGRWAVEERGRGAMIGSCGLVRYLEGTPEATGEVAYGLARSHWGLGLATEAARAAVLWGFATFEFPAVVGLTHPDNLASQRVLAKIGMHHLGQVPGKSRVVSLYSVERAAFR